MTPPVQRRLTIEHTSEFRYRETVKGSLLILRLRPRQSTLVRLLDFALHIDPVTVPVAFDDSFGNTCYVANIHRRHRRIHVSSLSQVAVSAPPGCSGQASAWDALAKLADPVRYWELLNPSHLVFPCEALDSFITTHGICRGTDPLSSLRDTASTLHKAFAYEPGSTEVHSSVEHILKTGRGVCQDYTHVLLAIGRSWGIPGRYVSGYLHNEGMSGEQSSASASHAWAEFLLPGLGWVGVDPTNNTLADHRHVPVAVGRDYVDAAPTRGTVFGGGESTLVVRVSVTESDKPGSAAPVHIERRVLTHFAPVPPAQKIVSGQQDQ